MKGEKLTEKKTYRKGAKMTAENATPQRAQR